MKLVAYLRVSTDDKGQDPDRQKRIIEAWAPRHGHEIVAWVKDEGTSGTVPPLNRQMVLEALELAEEHKAGGIVVESIDRWTRGGWQDLGVSMFLLGTEYKGTKLLVADLPQGDEFVAELIGGIMASVAKEFRRRLVAQVKSGLANAKAKGWPNGEPGRDPKPDLTQAEYEAVVTLMGGPKNPATGKKPGWRAAAHLVSTMRGAYLLKEPRAQREKAVSQTWLRKEMVRQETRSPTRVWLATPSPQESETRPAVPE